MRYRSINSLRDCEFHDAVWTLVSQRDGSLVGDVKFLNIHKDVEQNPYDCDMEIENARITLTGFRAIVHKQVFLDSIDRSGVRHPADPPIIVEGQQAFEGQD